MKKTVTPPASLYDDALSKENERHAFRLRQLKAMQTKLAQLDDHMPAIRAAGLYIYPSELTLDRDKSVYVPRPLFGSEGQRRLIELLKARGFKETNRADSTTFYSQTLSKGHLRMTFHVDKPREEWSAATIKASEGSGTPALSATAVIT